MALRRFDLIEWQPGLLYLSRSAAEELRDKHHSDFEVVPSWSTPEAFEVTPTGVIGVVQLSDCHLVVEPKVELDVAVRMLQDSVAEGGKLPAVNWQSVELAGGSFLSLMSLWFSELAMSVLERGVLRRYRRFESDLITVRGRVEVAATTRRSFRSAPPLTACTFDEFTEDNVENQTLRAVIQTLRGLPDPHPLARRRLQRIDSLLSAVTYRVPPKWERQAVRLDRLSQSYGPLLRLADWILDRAAPELSNREVTKTFGSFLVHMHDVFERSISARLRDSLVPYGYEVRRHQRLQVASDGLFTMEPDIIVEKPGGVLVVLDTKYKGFDSKYEPAESDVYQLTTYCATTGAARGLLVYPSKTTGQTPRTYHLTWRNMPLTLFPIELGEGPAGLERSVGQLADFLSAVAVGASD